MFKIATPESAGISSRNIYDFIKMMNDYKINTHSIIIAKDDNILAEGYWAPFKEDTLHRMYSVSKSFTSIAVGLAEQEGLLSLDDKFIDYFPEYHNENIDEKYRETTIREMLTMRSCMTKNALWWGKEDRAKSYFTETSNQVSGTNFHYDSAGSFLLGCIVEKVTGKPFLEYLKEKFLLEIGFSKESYCLKAPGGYSHSDSGVMCTTKDLLIFARFVMNGGVWNGKRYINEKFMRDAISKQTDNNINGITSPHYNNNGYGYLIWKMPRDGFGFIGMANQLAICDTKTGLIFVITAECMDNAPVTRTLILHELYKNIIEKISDPLPEDKDNYNKLCAYLENQEMLALEGSLSKNIADEISGKKYILDQNPMGINWIKLDFTENGGIFEFENREGNGKIEFGINHNKFGYFPEKKRMSITASVYEEGSYLSAASAIWCEEKKLHILVKVIDTYLGTLSIVLGFKGDKVTVTMQKHSQRILDNFNGVATGKCE